MKPHQCLEKFNEVLDKATDTMRIKAQSAMNSGAINWSDWEDDYLLPKIILCAVLAEEAYDWMPPDKKDKSEVKNIRAVI